MKQLIKKQKSLLKAFQKEVKKREDYFLSKPATWQDSLTGDKYSTITEMLQSFVDDTEATLSENGFN